MINYHIAEATLHDLFVHICNPRSNILHCNYNLLLLTFPELNVNTLEADTEVINMILNIKIITYIQRKV